MPQIVTAIDPHSRTIATSGAHAAITFFKCFRRHDGGDSKFKQYQFQPECDSLQTPRHNPKRKKKAVAVAAANANLLSIPVNSSNSRRRTTRREEEKEGTNEKEMIWMKQRREGRPDRRVEGSAFFNVTTAHAKRNINTRTHTLQTHTFRTKNLRESFL